MSKLEWNYTDLAKSYLKRPNYAPDLIEKLFHIATISEHSCICDMGAGVGHLTKELIKYKCKVFAVEPNDAMRQLGIQQTKGYSAIQWSNGTGEDSGLSSNTCHMETFGSSFNVTNQKQALLESKRIVKSGGYFACLWNHRDIEDEIQNEIQAIITHFIPNYEHGNRRQDQTKILENSGLFLSVKKLSSPVIHKQEINDCIQAWQSHATLERQAGNKFKLIIDHIAQYLKGLNTNNINIPYQTVAWIANFKN